MKLLLLMMVLLPILSPIRADEREMALIPIGMTGITIPGSRGSQWETSFAAYNSGEEEAFIRFLDWSCLYITPCGEGAIIEPEQVERDFEWAQGPDTSIGYPHGVLIYYAPEDGKNLHFHLRIRDISRETDSAGTEIPVVREAEFRTDPLHLLDVPAGPLFRTHLRLYGPDGVGGRILVSFFDQATNGLLAQEIVSLEIPPIFRFFPDYAEIGDIRQRHPVLRNSDLIRIAVEPLEPGLRFWAFVSITNNETQQVTLVTPR